LAYTAILVIFHFIRKHTTNAAEATTLNNSQFMKSFTPEDDPRKMSKHVALPPTANKNKFWGSSAYFIFFRIIVCID
jgi:hypothetical protein